MSYTILLRLELKPDCTIERKSTLDGQCWMQALLEVAAQTGWDEFWWGRHIGNESFVELLIEWSTFENAVRFRDSQVAVFYGRLGPVLKTTPPPPMLADFISFSQRPFDQVTALYYLRYPLKESSAENRIYSTMLGIYNQIVHKAPGGFREEEMRSRYDGLVAAWVDQVADAEEEVMVIQIMMAPEDGRAEYEKTVKLIPGGEETVYEAYLKPTICSATRGYDKCLVEWNLVFDSNLEGFKRTGKAIYSKAQAAITSAD